jgi:hypothetical protein
MRFNFWCCLVFLAALAGFCSADCLLALVAPSEVVNNRVKTRRSRAMMYPRFDCLLLVLVVFPCGAV